MTAFDISQVCEEGSTVSKSECIIDVLRPIGVVGVTALTLGYLPFWSSAILVVASVFLVGIAIREALARRTYEQKENG
jgi:hypothetical protein